MPHVRPRHATLMMALSALLLAALLPSGCGVENEQVVVVPLEDVVMTTFYPTQYFAERIAGGLVPVRSPLPDDEDPIFWRPDADAMAQFQNAKLIITNGVDFEKWVAGAALPRIRTVESLSATALDEAGGPITMEATTHSHGPAGEHTHEGLDGHTWVAPTLAKIQARRIADAMGATWPEHKAAFDANYQSLLEDLDLLHASLLNLSSKIQDVTLLASHPAYNYLARAFGWHVHNLDLDPEYEDAQAVVKTVHDALHEEGGLASDDKPIVLLWEGQPTDAIVQALANELGVVSVLFSPAETRPDHGDYMDVMRTNADRLREALGG